MDHADHEPADAVSRAEEEEMLINEEFTVWRKNVPYLYDMLLSHALTWPSLSVQWFPEAVRNEEAECTVQKLLLSSHTSGQEEEYLQIVTLSLPDMVSDATVRSLEDGGYGFGSSRVRISQQIPVPKEVNRARYMPGDSRFIATRTDSPEVCVYDYTKHPSFAKEASPEVVFRDHTSGGYALLWNHLKEGELLSAGYDGLICSFQLGEGETSTNQICLKEEVNDISLSQNTQTLAAALEKHGCVLLDRRDGSRKTIAPRSSVLCAEFSLADSFLLGLGTKSGSASVWDIRNEREPLHVLSEHGGEVTQIQWSPHFEHVLSTSGTDRRVRIWDLERVGATQTEEEREDGPPELLFVHGGHTDAVSDISWNPHEPWELASVAEDNVLQVWQVSREVAPDEEEEVPETSPHSSQQE